MRDDVRAQLEELSSLYSVKISLLKKLSLSESDKSVYLKANDTLRLLEAIESDESIYTEIDSLDFEITAIKDSLSAILGIEPHMLFKVLKEDGDLLVQNIFGKIDEIKRQLKEILQEHTALVSGMEKMQAEIMVDRKVLSRLIKFDISE